MSAGNGVAVTTAPLIIFDSTKSGPDNAPSGNGCGSCTTYMVKNRGSSTGNLLVNVQGLHASGEYVGIAPGDAPVYFRLGLNGISKVTVQTDTSTATIDHGVIAKL